MSNFEFLLDGEPINASIEKTPEGFLARVGERIIELRPLDQNLLAASLNGRTASVAVVRSKGRFYLDIDSVQVELTEPSDEISTAAGADHAGQKDKIFAPMPGKIVKIMVDVGAEVQPKQPLVVVEAMKMENQVNAQAKGRVKAVNFAAGDQVDTERPIIELELLT